MLSLGCEVVRKGWEVLTLHIEIHRFVTVLLI